MRTSVPRKRRGLDDICVSASKKETRVYKAADTYVTEGFATRFVLAHVRAFSRVRSVMYRQGRALNKLLSATGPFAVVRPFPGMNPSMPREIRASREPFAAMVPGARVLFIVATNSTRTRGRSLGILGVVKQTTNIHGNKEGKRSCLFFWVVTKTMMVVPFI